MSFPVTSVIGSLRWPAVERDTIFSSCSAERLLLKVISLHARTRQAWCTCAWRAPFLFDTDDHITMDVFDLYGPAACLALLVSIASGWLF